MHRTFAAAGATIILHAQKKSALSANHNKQTDRRRKQKQGKTQKWIFAYARGRSLVKSSGIHRSLSIGFRERASVF